MASNITAITGGTPAVKANVKAPSFAKDWTIYTALVALTDATIAAQVAGKVDVTIPGAALGDFVLVSYPADLGGIIISGRVKAADTVEIVTFNVEGTDAVTTMNGGLTAKIVVLHPNFSFT